MKKKILWLTLSWLIVAALVLSSCAKEVPGEQEEEEEEEEEPVGEQEEEEEEEEEEEPAAGVPQYGGTLTVHREDVCLDSQSWDSALGGYYLTCGQVSPVQEYLFGGDASRGMTGTKEFFFVGRYVPIEFTRGELIESWELSTDPLRLIWHVRKGVYWQDKPGVMEAREFTADDVYFNIRRRLDDPRGGILANPILWEWIDTITVVDRYTLYLELNSVYPDWLYQIGWGMGCNQIPPELVEAGIEDWRNVTGTGPFMLTDYVSGSLLKYTRNPNYWDTCIIDGKEFQMPLINELVWPIIPDLGVRVASLRTGKLDILQECPWEYMDSLASTNPELLVWEIPTPWFAEVALRHDTPPFDDIRVRKAMNMAIDRQAIIDTLCGGYAINDNFVSCAGWGEKVWTPLTKYPPEVQVAYTYNPEGARKLLAEAGYPDGFESKLSVQSQPRMLNYASLCIKYWDAIGVEVTEVKPVDMAVMWASFVEKNYEGIYFRGTNSAPTPAFGLMDYWPGAAENLVIYDDPTFVAMFEEYKVEPDVDKQNALLKAMNEYLVSDLASLWLPDANSFRYAWPWVKNYEGEENTKYRSGTDIFSRLWIDQNLKAEMGY